MVLRLKGTNSDIAKKMISGKEKELNIYYDEDFDHAAQLVCRVAKEQWVDAPVTKVKSERHENNVQSLAKKAEWSMQGVDGVSVNC